MPLCAIEASANALRKGGLFSLSLVEKYDGRADGLSSPGARPMCPCHSHIRCLSLRREQAFSAIQGYGIFYIPYDGLARCPISNGVPLKTGSIGPSMASGSSLPSVRFWTRFA